MKLLDLFSGIGGFHKGFEQAGYNFEWVGFSDIDKYASAVYKYRYSNAKELGNITTIRPERDLPDHIDILCGGFPCQSFSQSGLRRGFKDTRGTLFFEIARILRYFRDNKKPIPYFVLENVKGLLSHDSGRTFAIIYRVLTDIGYTVECQLLNTRWVLPQNRERIYIVGYIGRGSGCKVFPITENDEVIKKQSREKNRESTSMQNGYSRTINSRIHKMGCEDTYIKVKEATKKGYAKARIGDSIDFSFPNSKSRRGRVGKGEAQTLDTGVQQYTLQYSQKSINETLEKANLKKDDIKALDLYNKKAQDISPTLTEPHHNSLRLYDKTQVRRLTPVECMRLQGFPDDWNEKGILDNKVVDISDTQRYKQAGNAVTVSIVQLIAEKMKMSLLNE
jgi:DNA (cytosine-5)-methyltransferase 1